MDDPVFESLRDAISQCLELRDRQFNSVLESDHQLSEEEIAQRLSEWDGQIAEAHAEIRRLIDGMVKLPVESLKPLAETDGRTWLQHMLHYCRQSSYDLMPGGLRKKEINPEKYAETGKQVIRICNLLEKHWSSESTSNDEKVAYLNVDSEGTALKNALMPGGDDAVQRILELVPPSMDSFIKVRDKDGYGLLPYAADSNSVEMYDELYGLATDEEREKSFYVSLQFAINSNATNTLSRILHSSHKSTNEERIYFALFYALERGKLEAAKYILGCGKDLGVSLTGDVPSWLVEYDPPKAIVKALIKLAGYPVFEGIHYPRWYTQSEEVRQTRSQILEELRKYSGEHFSKYLREALESHRAWALLDILPEELKCDTGFWGDGGLLPVSVSELERQHRGIGVLAPENDSLEAAFSRMAFGKDWSKSYPGHAVQAFWSLLLMLPEEERYAVLINKVGGASPLEIMMKQHYLPKRSSVFYIDNLKQFVAEYERVEAHLPGDDKGKLASRFKIGDTSIHEVRKLLEETEVAEQTTDGVVRPSMFDVSPDVGLFAGKSSSGLAEAARRGRARMNNRRKW